MWEHPEKYGITRIREAALSCLGPDVSFMSLTEWKQGHSGVYLAEAALETLPFTDSLLRFDMADELVLYVLPRFQGEGFRLFEGCPGFSLWELAGMRSFDRDVCCLHYRRVAGG
ncbi:MULTISPECIES: deaminase [Bacteroidales]|uniref:deaminase n=1 Tax=Bacteroidales TaxID=171549 RepID=UPI001E2E9BEA|nr:deaminase [Bacteroides caccae]